MDRPPQWATLRPAGGSQLGFGRELVDIADTEIRHDLQVRWQVEQRGKVTLVEEADPADADAFCACGQPQIFHGETG